MNTKTIKTLSASYRAELRNMGYLAADLRGATWQPVALDGAPDGVEVTLRGGKVLRLRGFGEEGWCSPDAAQRLEGTMSRGE